MFNSWKPLSKKPCFLPLAYFCIFTPRIVVFHVFKFESWCNILFLNFTIIHVLSTKWFYTVSQSNGSSLLGLRIGSLVLGILFHLGFTYSPIFIGGFMSWDRNMVYTKRYKYLYLGSSIHNQWETSIIWGGWKAKLLNGMALS